MKLSTIRLIKNGVKFSSIAFMFVVLGCSKPKSNSADVPAPVVVPPPVAPPGANIIPPGSGGALGNNGGHTVEFTPKDLATMTDYVAISPLNNPTNFKINVNLAQVEAGRYGGEVRISYIDNGMTHQGVFKAGTGKNQKLDGLRDSGLYESEYNYWFQYNNRTVFSGYFQDNFGALVLVISRDESVGESADAEGYSGAYTGHVYYKNFTKQFSTQSPYRSCWFIYNGPYDCRSNIVSTKCGLYPEAGYKFLGTFKNLDISKAFNY